MGGQSLFQLGLSEGGWIHPLVALHILPPDNSHIVLQLEELYHIQVSSLVCLQVLVKELKEPKRTQNIQLSKLLHSGSYDGRIKDVKYFIQCNKNRFGCLFNNCRVVVTFQNLVTFIVC